MNESVASVSKVDLVQKDLLEEVAIRVSHGFTEVCYISIYQISG